VLWPSIDRGVLWPSIDRGVLWLSIDRGVLWPSIDRGVLWPSIDRGVLWPSIDRGVLWPSLQGSVRLRSTGKCYVEIRTGIPHGYFFVSKTCHDALSIKNRDKVSVSVFVTVVKM